MGSRVEQYPKVQRSDHHRRCSCIACGISYGRALVSTWEQEEQRKQEVRVYQKERCPECGQFNKFCFCCPF